MKRASIILLISLSALCSASSSPIVRDVKLLEDVQVQYGTASYGKFEITSNQNPLVHDCTSPIIIAFFTNPRENFDMPSDKARLIINASCLQCTSIGGRTTERKMSGSITGKGLAGTNFEEWTIDSNGAKTTIFGLGIEKASLGKVQIDSLGEIGSCS